MKPSIKVGLGLLSVIMVACQPGVIPLQTQANVSKINPKPSLKPRVAQYNPGKTFLKESPLESAEAILTSSGAQDALTLTVVLKKDPRFSIQKVDVDRIAFLKAWVKRPENTTLLYNINDFIQVNAGGPNTSLQIVQVPKGKNRVVSVQGYDASNSHELVNGALLKAMYDSPDNSNSVTLTFTWRTTAAANVLEHIIAQNPELAESLDTAALQTLIDNIIQYDTNTQTSVVHPSQVDAQELATLILQNHTQDPNASPIPSHTAGDPVPAGWLQTKVTANVVAQTATGGSFANNQVTLQITDPSSRVSQITLGNDSADILEVIPGNWEVIAKVPGLNGGISKRTTVTVDDAGNINLTQGTNGNPLKLPPLLTAQSTTSAATGSQITLTGEGFDTTPSNNTVKFGNTTATVVSATANSLVVEVPEGLLGNDIKVTVETAGQTSNYAEIDIDKAVTKLSKPGGKVGDQLTLSVSGFDASTSNPTVVFNGGSTATVLGTTANTITVEVPAGAQTGAITVTPENDAPLQSPVYTLDLPVISQFPANAALNTEITVTGANFTGTTGVTINGTNAPTFNVVDDNTIKVTVPAGATTGKIEVTAPAGSGQSQTDLTIMAPPTIFTLAPNTFATGPVIISGFNFTHVNEVTVDGFVIPPANYTIVNDNQIHLNSLPNAVSSGTIKVTNPVGSDSAPVSIQAYKDVENFIGGSRFYSPVNNYLDSGGVNNVVAANTLFENTLSAVQKAANIHGVNVDTNGNVYVTDLYNKIHKFDKDGNHQLTIGTVTSGLELTPVPFANAHFASPEDAADDPSGNIYVADTANNAIRKIDFTNNTVSTLARVWGPEGIEYAKDANGNGVLYVTCNRPHNSPTDTWVVQINDLNTIPAEDDLDDLPTDAGAIAALSTAQAEALFTSNVTILAGGARITTPAVGEVTPMRDARFRHLEGLGSDGNGNIFIADVDNKQIRKFSIAENKVTVFADVSDIATLHEIRVDPYGNVFAPATNNQIIFKWAPNGERTRIAGKYSNPALPSAGGVLGVADGNPTQTATFAYPKGIDFGPDGTLYVSDASWGIRRIERFHPWTP